MDTRTQGALMLAVGGVAIRLAVSGNALNYIKVTYVPLLLVSGAVLAVLGGVTLWRALGRSGEPTPGNADDHASTAGDAHGGHGHDHERGPRIAWLLAAPLFAILLIAPPPLGSFAASRQSGVLAEPTGVFPPLPDDDGGVVSLTLGDYATRALYDTDLSLAGRSARLVGFVSRATDEGFILTRFKLSCCAADGTAINVEVLAAGPPPAVDAWVEVTGDWTPRQRAVVGELTTDPPLIDASTVRPIPQPAEPYEN